MKNKAHYFFYNTKKYEPLHTLLSNIATRKYLLYTLLFNFCQIKKSGFAIHKYLKYSKPHNSFFLLTL
ncbi:MAG: hypothetical protein WC157_02010, partial [Candidatus Paceibacterota bacterium]